MTITDAPAAPPAPAPKPRVSRVRGWVNGFGRPPRIMGLDIARGLAILGMVGAHVGLTGELDPLSPQTWGALVNGRSSILFALLAGISIALMTGRHAGADAEELPRLRLNLMGRGAIIFVIGIVLELLTTPVAVILTVYGLLYVAALPFLRWRPRQLFAAAAVLAVLGPPLLAGVRLITLGASGPGVGLVLFGTYPITVWMAFVLAGMALGRLRLDSIRTAWIMLAAGAALALIGFAIGLAGPAQPGSDSWGSGSSGSGSGSSSSSSFAPGSSSSGGDVAVGVPADRIDLSGKLCDDFGDGWVTCYPESTAPDGTESAPMAGDGGWAMYPQQLAEQAPGQALLASLTASEPHTGGTAEILGSGGFAIAVTALCLLLSRPLRWLLLPLAALGSMPLTAYSGHILAILIISGPQSIPSGDAEWAWFSLVLVLAATVWSIFAGRGPLERMVGSAARAMATAPGRRSGP